MKETIRMLLFKTLRTLANPFPRIHGFVQRSLLHGQTALTLEPGSETVVVLAPHMDDEAIGCGGTIARHAAAGGNVTVVFLTDSRYGSTLAAQQQLIATRKQESELANEILGVKRRVFLDADAAHLGTDALTAKRLQAILEEIRPSIVYLPFFLERHPDHRITSDVLIAATRDTALSFECRCYEVWTPLFPNRVVCIDATVELKKRAIGCYQSQLAHTDFLHIGLGLNAYRSSTMISNGCRFVEAFYALPLREYRQLYGTFSRSSWQ